MIMQYGMSETLGFVSYGGDAAQQYYFGQTQKNYSEEVAGEIDKEIHKYMEEAYEACRTIINDNRDKLEQIAQALMDKETLTAQELKDIVFANKVQLEKPPVADEPPPPPEPVELVKEVEPTPDPV